MSDNARIRAAIVQEAARLLRDGQERSAAAAKHRAARSLYRSFVPPDAFPRDTEVAAAATQLETRTPTDVEVTEDNPDAPDWASIAALLRPLERIDLPERSHAGCNALDHSLRTYLLTRDALPYDDDAQLAALLSNVGWAIDPRDAHEATLANAAEVSTVRTLEILTHLPDALERLNGTLGSRARARLNAIEDADEVAILAESYRAAKQVGRPLLTIDEAIHRIRTLAE